MILSLSISSTVWVYAKGEMFATSPLHLMDDAIQGSSVIMYRSADLRRHQYYINPSWSGLSIQFLALWFYVGAYNYPGGLYASPSLSGSR